MYNNQTYNEKISEYITFKLGIITIIVLSFYVYLKAIFPGVSFLKDALILLSIISVILSVISSKGKVSKPNYIDIIIICLLLYLFFQFINTAYLTKSILATYYGFRLTFMYIFLYFLFRTISSPNYQNKIDSLVITILALGCAITLVEFIVVNTGLLSVEKLVSLLGKEETLSGGEFLAGYASIKRVIGIAGTPQITGVYNVVFFSLLLFSMSIPHYEYYISKKRPFVKYKNLNTRKILLVLSFIAVFISTSKTAWTILFIILLVFPFCTRKISLRNLFKTVLILSITVGIIYTTQTRLINDTYFMFLAKYAIMFQMYTMDVINNSPLIGFGFEVGAYSNLLDITKIRLENIIVTSDLFIAQLFRMLGFIGLILFLSLFIIIPLRTIFSSYLNGGIKILAVPVLAVGISFGHYNPLENPPLALCVWYFLALISNEISINKRNIKQFNNINFSYTK